MTAPGVSPDQAIAAYQAKLSDRHFQDLKFGEVTRALRALSAGYVEKRETGGLARALDGRGKRAAFALYYGTTHLLVARLLVREFGLAFGADPKRSGRTRPPTILDLGCGTGVCGAAWAMEGSSGVSITGADRSSFALHEARWTYQTLRLRGETSRSIIELLDASRPPEGIVLGWTLNELDDPLREAVAQRIVPWVTRGCRLLVIEPVSKRVTPWWDEWTARFPKDVCVAAERRLRLDFPPKIALLARSAGLDATTTVVKVLASRIPAC